MTPHFHRGEQVDALTRYARLATLFPAPNGQAFAAIPTGAAARQVCPVASAVFKDWLIENFIKEYETAPAPAALRQALGAAEALALCGDIPPQKVNRRVAAIGDAYEPTKIVIDLVPQWRAFEAGQMPRRQKRHSPNPEATRHVRSRTVSRAAD